VQIFSSKGQRSSLGLRSAVQCIAIGGRPHICRHLADILTQRTPRDVAYVVYDPAQGLRLTSHVMPGLHDQISSSDISEV